MNAKLYHENFLKIKFALKGPKSHFYVKKCFNLFKNCYKIYLWKNFLIVTTNI